MSTVNICLLKSFNNYYNRIIKKYDVLSDYLLEVEDYRIIGNSLTSNGIAFNPNDGIGTTQVINWQESWNPDYLLILDRDTSTILSRWFVIESKRTRANQYTITLKRDSIADFYDDVINAPVFIEKATVSGNNDPAIFNNEQITFNKIKKSETLLKDDTGCAWIVGYYDKTQRASLSGTLDSVDFSKLGGEIININSKFESWLYHSYVENPFEFIRNYSIHIVGLQPSIGGVETVLKSDGKDWSSFQRTQYPALTQLIITDDLRYHVRERLLPLADASETTLPLFKTLINSLDSISEDLVELTSDTGKIIKDTDGRLFRLSLNRGPLKTSIRKITSSDGALFVALSNYIYQGGSFTIFGLSGSINNDCFEIEYTYEPWTLSYEELTEYSLNWSLGSTNRVNTVDAPYNLFAIPYGDNVYVSNGGDQIYKLEKTDAINLASAIALNSSIVFDIQLLPYCPLNNLKYVLKPSTTSWIGFGGKRYFRESSNDQTISGVRYYAWLYLSEDEPGQNIYTKTSHLTTNVTTYTINGGVALQGPDTEGFFEAKTTQTYIDLTQMSTDSYSVIKTYNDEIKALIFDVAYSNFSFNINKRILISESSYKIENEVNSYRLCSGNYSSSFEFSLAKNGIIDFFKVDCAYKPYAPYIHVAPNWGKLYGQDFGDARGLICAGDYSLTQLSDAWKNYQINNKNYLNIFDRQIENMEINNAYQRISQAFNIGTGAIGGATSGAQAGFNLGGGAGAIAGGVIGGVASLTGGLVDYTMSEQLRHEAIDYTKDQFG